MRPATRLPCNNVDITLGATEAVEATETTEAKPAFAGHPLTVSLADDPETGLLREVVFVTRGKIGSGIDLMFHELGIKLSRAIQGRDPETGAAP